MATAFPGFSAALEEDPEAAAVLEHPGTPSEVEGDSLIGRLSEELRLADRKPLLPSDPEGRVTRVGLVSLPPPVPPVSMPTPGLSSPVPRILKKTIEYTS